MLTSMQEPTTIHNAILPTAQDPHFPWAPVGWSVAEAERRAQEEGVSLSADHWEAIRAVQEFFVRNTPPRARVLHDALDEKFHAKGGIRYLYKLFPGGPIAQGCRLAGLTPPAGAVDKSFGSVQ
jgi:tRNA 2-thiouridine synthesizing protein E